MNCLLFQLLYFSTLEFLFDSFFKDKFYLLVDILYLVRRHYYYIFFNSLDIIFFRYLNIFMLTEQTDAS